MVDEIMPMSPMPTHTESQDNLIQRGIPEPGESRKNYVLDWHRRITTARDQTFDKQFKRMRDNMNFVRGKQWSDEEADERYRCNLTLRYLQKRTAALYAKNPRAIAKPRSRLEYAIWDGKPESLMMAQENPNDPVMALILQDFHQGTLRKMQFEGIAKTLEYLYDYYMHEERPAFKQQIKQLVRRVLTTGVGYVKIGFRRDMSPSPDQMKRIKDFQARLDNLEMLAADMADDKMEDSSKEMEEMRLSIEAVMREEQQILREGLILDFPSSMSIIPDPNCCQLKGFVGANWISQEYYFSVDEVKKLFKVDLASGSAFKAYTVDHKRNYMQGMTGTQDDKTLARVWELYDLINGNVLYLCEGYPDLLRQDVRPQLTFEQGHPYHVLTFNDLEDEHDIFPPADVSLMRDQQMEYNRSRESLREHRIAARPAWISPKGMWDEDDLNKIGNHLAHELLQLNIPVTQNLDINKLIIPKPVASIDPNVYDVEFLFQDVLRATGDHEATFGGSSGDTATEVSVAEASRVSSVESNIDDLDDFLTSVARDSGQILLLQMSAEQVKEIVGPGALWPKFSAQEAANEIILEIQAGSSGRPNRAQELANIERVAPYIIQIPGINPRWLAETVLTRMDDKLDLTEAFAENMPSITALNAMAKTQAQGFGQPGQEGEQAGGGPPQSQNAGGGNGTDNQPQNQGGQGGNNMEDPQQGPPGGQPAYPGITTQ